MLVCRRPGPDGYADRRTCRADDVLDVEALPGWSCRVTNVLVFA